MAFVWFSKCIRTCEFVHTFFFLAARKIYASVNTPFEEKILVVNCFRMPKMSAMTLNEEEVDGEAGVGVPKKNWWTRQLKLSTT